LQLPDPITLADAAYYYNDQMPAHNDDLWWISHERDVRDVFWEFAHRIDSGEIRPALSAWGRDGKRDYLHTTIRLKDFFRVARERNDCLPVLAGRISEPTSDAGEMTETRAPNPVGRPPGKAVSLASFKQRRNAGIALEPTLKAEAEAICESWPEGEGTPRRKPSTVENHIRDEYRKARKDTGL
jgi:hypothetical protein